MKLKYYIRGMGVGIVLTALVLSIAYRGEQLSDEEIIRRATSLGMVMKDDNSPKLDKLIDEIKPGSTATGDTTGQDLTDAGGRTNEPELTGTPGDNKQPSGEGKADEISKPANDNASEGKQTEEAGNADEGKQGGSGDGAGNTDKADKNDTKDKADEDKQTDEAKEVRQISFTIERGMSSSKVAKLLEQKGLIDDAEDFNRYIISKGKASVIRVGSYTLPKGSSYNDIIKAITR